MRIRGVIIMRSRVRALAVVVALLGIVCFGASDVSKPFLGYNEDFWHFFTVSTTADEANASNVVSLADYMVQCPENLRRYPATEKGLVSYLDDVLRGQVTHFFMNVNCQRAGFDSKTLEPFWKNWEELKDDNLERDLVLRAKSLHDQGVDPYAVWCRRCREKNVSPWVSVRMNDMHRADKLDCPSLSDWWRNHPEFRRVPYANKDWGKMSLDFGHKEVRDRMLAFIGECLSRYDMDGVELDWTRMLYVFAEGEEAKNAPLLTDFVRQVRRLADAAAVRLGHSVGVSCRCAARPDVMAARGYDIQTWAREGLVDMVDAGNNYLSADYEIPVEKWREMLGDKVKFIAHVDFSLTTDARRTLSRSEYLGWADVMSAQGCENFTLFNFFSHSWKSREWNETLDKGLLGAALSSEPRTYPLSYRDSPYDRGYPRRFPFVLDKPFSCEIPVGSLPESGAAIVRLCLRLKDRKCERPEVSLNGVNASSSLYSAEARINAAYSFPLSALQSGKNTIVVSAAPGCTLTYAAIETSKEQSFNPADVFGAPEPRAALRKRLAEESEIIGIVHWGLNTYTDSEWGFGNADPALLAPAKFDANQIVEACRAGGICGLVVVAKHHDGFCLWPTKTTDYNITKSPFRGGSGDYVREMERACRKAGLQFGIYVSPWDRNSAYYATEKYVEIYHEQIKELLGGAYGEVFEMWFDGANGGNGWYGGANETRKIKGSWKYYRIAEILRFIRERQPNITAFDGGGDGEYTWPGNEKGFIPEGAVALTERIFRLYEADFPLRRGWFWHAKQRGTTKSPLGLLKRYILSVGRGGTMNIGIAPNKDGVLDEEDVRALAEFKALKDELLADKNVKVIRDRWGVKTIDVGDSEIGRRALAVELGGETDTANWMANKSAE